MDAFIAETTAGGHDTDHEDDPQPNNTTTEPENKFQMAISAWRGVDLTGLIPQLDATATEIVNNQKDALVERKEVASRTKEFRKLEDAAKLGEIKSLLKSYQTFIDLLTTHGKTSSSAFLQIYTPLSDAPDPFPLLEASVEALVTAEDTLPKVLAENAELQKRVNRLSSQLEETEGKLREESTARRETDAGSADLINKIEAKWTKVLEEKQSNWEAKERALEEKVENQDRLLKELKASYEVAQRLGQDEENRGDSVYGKAATAELDMLNSELEKTSARLVEMETRNEQLRLDLARESSQNATQQSHEDEAELLRLRSENSSLMRKIESARFEKTSEKREWHDKMRQVERQRSQLAEEVQAAKTKLQKFSNYDELKRELEVLRTIELSAENEDEDDAPTTNGSADKGHGQSLDKLLLAKNKKLSSDMTLLRVAHQDLEQQLRDLQEEFSQTNAELEKSQKLASTLENDLLKIQEEADNAMPSSGRSVAGTYTSRHPGSMRRGGRASPTSSIISGYDSIPRSASATLESLRSGEPVGGGSGILPMIQAQRDRFKQKNHQLEEELQKTYATVTSLRQEVASLQKDNLSLYEKSRYVSTYSRGGNTSSSGYSGGISHTRVHAEEDPEVDKRWKSAYEANISPFAAFRGKESTRAYNRMSLPERMIFSLTRIVLATRISRNIFALYCVALHLLVFSLLYWTGTADIEKHMVGEIGAAGAAVAGAAAKGGAAMGEAGSEWQQEGFG
ncbi:Protein CASP [Cyphellophora attinorum]|uniref:Protein CASP n=1 Tax=Cyphellophora attinorum TaxID=1664694 RepID=A0A0N1H9J5_9EURO|nr:Protein CASP [Phialophora attinorum]KPI38846.1 Protein CASP [Phialophora attinorum]